VIDRTKWPTIAPTALSSEAVGTIAKMLIEARRPLVVTSYLGRNVAAVAPLVRLCERLGIGVVESVPNHLSFPHDHPLHQGGQWNEKKQNVGLAEADVVLVIDSDVPWIPQINRPSKDAKIIHIDIGPLKQQMPLWYIGAEQVYRADAELALNQLNAYLDSAKMDAGKMSERRAHYERRHMERRAILEKA